MEYLIGLSIGVALGMSGAGGVFAIPLIVIFLNLPVNQAMGTALGVVMLSASMGLYSQRAHVLLVPAIILGFTGVLTAPVGRTIAMSIDDVQLLLCFFVVSLLISVSVWFNSNKRDLSSVLIEVPSFSDFFRVDRQAVSDRPVFHQILNSVFSSVSSNRSVIFVMLFFGLLVGFFSGLLGIGGGIFIIPFLCWYLRISMKAALATSLMVIVMISCSGFFSALILHKQVDLVVLAKLAPAAMLGIVLGHKVGALFEDGVLQKIFSISLIIVCLTTLYSEIAA